MGFVLFWIDFFITDNLYGFGFLSFKDVNYHKSFLAFYWNEGELLIDLLWIHIYKKHPFWFWWFYKDEK